MLNFDKVRLMLRFPDQYDVIRYQSENGYSGILYGKSSMAVFDPEGKEVMHTGFRTPNTYAELKEVVDEIPDLIAVLKEFSKNSG